MDNVTKWYEVLKAAKAWAGSVVFAVGEIITAAQVAVADEAISLTEAQGIRVLVVQALTIVAGFFTIFQVTNKEE